MRFFMCLMCVLFFGTPLWAQETTSSAIEERIIWNPLEINIFAFDTISQSKVDLIISLMEVNRTIENLQKNFRQVYTSVDESQKDKIMNAIDIHEIVEEMVPIYDKYYTELDLQQLIVFFKSPIGAKMMDVTPNITQEAIMVSAEYFKTKLK